MKRPWPEEDDFFFLGVAMAVFFTVCFVLLYEIGGG